MIEILKIFFSVPFLLYSCYSDLNSRRVSNKVWKYMLASGSGFVFFMKFLQTDFPTLCLFFYQEFSFLRPYISFSSLGLLEVGMQRG
ncbi:prepilin peptidase [Methanosarcina barkeri]|uniref:prepilin peptidase n=1 Tax=Methanosarcina barkeri TaxID=2208 RepID=UPI00373FCAD2